MNNILHRNFLESKWILNKKSDKLLGLKVQ
jgi:hypothetical protein